MRTLSFTQLCELCKNHEIDRDSPVTYVTDIYWNFLFLLSIPCPWSFDAECVKWRVRESNNPKLAPNRVF